MASKQPYRILFDAGPLMSGQMSGVGYYTKGLIESLAKAHPEDLQLTGYYHNFLGRKHIDFGMTLPNVDFKPVRYFPGIILRPLSRLLGLQVPIELLVFRRYDLHLFPNFVSLPSLRRTPSAVVIHDLAYLDHPQYVNRKNVDYLKRMVPRCIRRARYVLTVSEFSKQRIMETYRPTAPIIVTPIPPVTADIAHSKLNKRLRGLGIEQHRYLLFLGTIEPRKNLICLLKAYEQLPPRLRQTFSLVLAGGKGWHDEEILSTIESLQANGDRVIATGYVSDQEKAALYKHASAVVLPAHYEGFGMPALEALAAGTPLFASDIPAFREVAGDSATYFDPKDAAALSKLLIAFLEKQPPRRKFNAVLARYDWNRIATGVYEVFTSPRSE